MYSDAGGRSLLIGDRLENYWLATSNSCSNRNDGANFSVVHSLFTAINDVSSIGCVIWRGSRGAAAKLVSNPNPNPSSM